MDVLGNFVWRDYQDYKDGNGDDVAGSGFDVLSGLLKATIRPTDTSDLKLGWIGSSDSWTEGGDTYSLDADQNIFTGRYHVTDEDESWLDLHVNGSFDKTGLDQTYLTDVARFDSRDGSAYRRSCRLADDLRCRYLRPGHLEHVALRHRRRAA